MYLICLSLFLLCVSAAWEDGHFGVDRPGSNLLSPFVLDSQSTARDCYFLCEANENCKAWVYAPPQCVDGGVLQKEGGLCWLKAEIPPLVIAEEEDYCRISGVMVGDTPLLPLTYVPLKLGMIKPQGWLANQLVIQGNGLGGHLSLFWADVNQSVWVGGRADVSGAGHERAPYWLNGMVPLLGHLQAGGLLNRLNVDLKEQVDYFINYILNHQLPSGWLGPDDGFGGKGNTYWTAWDVCLALMQYAQFNPSVEQRATKAVFAYIQEAHRRMLTTPMESWSQNRWADWTYICQMMIDNGWTFSQEQLLWDAGALAQQQGYNWNGYYSRTGQQKFPSNAVPGWTLWDHGVNNGMALKGGAVWYRQSKNPSDANQSNLRVSMLEQYHGLPSGIFSADECFGGRHPSRGTELCTVVEYIFSLNHIFSVQGGTDYADRAERATYNALPAEITPDMWAHQYLQQPNEINAEHTDPHIWETDGPDSTIFGLAPNFGCCTANFVQGWPKFVTFAFLITQDNGIAISQYAPLSATFPANVGGGANVNVVTDYPFGDTVSVTIKATAAVPFYFRAPKWATTGVVTVNGGSPIPLAAGTMQKIAVSSGTTQIVIDFKPQIRIETGWGYTNSAAVLRGPLVYSLALQENFVVSHHYAFNSNDYVITTPSQWNYGLLLDQNNPASTLTFEYISGPGSIPFNNTDYTQVIHAKGRLLPNWGVKIGAADQPPQSPVTCGNCGPVTNLVLVPFGSTDLRIGAFPWISS